jgi:hypothetical protein
MPALTCASSIDHNGLASAATIANIPLVALEPFSPLLKLLAGRWFVPEGVSDPIVLIDQLGRGRLWPADPPG